MTSLDYGIPMPPPRRSGAKGNGFRQRQLADFLESGEREGRVPLDGHRPLVVYNCLRKSINYTPDMKGRVAARFRTLEDKSQEVWLERLD
jgi:hypothetical protein